MHRRLVRQRQIDAAQSAGRAGKADEGPGADRKARRFRDERKRACRIPAAASGIHLPKLQPAARADGHRKCRAAADVQGYAEKAAREDCARRAEKDGPARPRKAQAHRDVRRPAAARGHCARLCRKAEGDFCGRTDGQPRFQHLAAGAVYDAGDGEGIRHYIRDGNARARACQLRRPHRYHQGRPRAGKRAAERHRKGAKSQAVVRRPCQRRHRRAGDDRDRGRNAEE